MKKLIILTLLLNSFVYSFDKISLGYAETTYDAKVYNLTLSKDLNYELFKTFPLSFEVSLDSIDANSSDDFTIGSIQPTLTYNFSNNLFIDAGVGISYFSQKEFDDRRFGMHFQFKESLSLGYKINENISTSFRYTHFSNANLDEDNSGFDLFMLSVSYKF